MGSVTAQRLRRLRLRRRVVGVAAVVAAVGVVAVVVTRPGIGAVVRQLCIEPSIQRLGERRTLGAVGRFCTGR